MARSVVVLYVIKVQLSIELVSLILSFPYISIVFFSMLCVTQRSIGIIFCSLVYLFESMIYVFYAVPNFMIQGGDISNGKGGESIYGGFFEDESFEVKYNTVYLLSMANRGYRNTNGSQFFINTVKTSWLDKKHAAIGVVLKGKNIVDKIGTLGRRNGKPKEVVTIHNSGELKPKKDSVKK